ncbi:MAG: 2-oxoglutarate and iron-dependent oxygenase domain-containing protein, partial [Pseudomonadota bacterium]|nr:2-oxoglutarate and iron-dependent oxygenase domain-containing protein [Pseudomonadota bacterium]
MKVETVDYRAADAAETLARSLRDTGFAVLANHPITADRIDAIYNAWGGFFAGEDKFDFAVKPPAHDGYFAFRSENAKDSPVKDLKEFFHVYPGCALPTDIEAMTREIYADLENLGRELLGWIQGQAPAEVTDSLSMPLDEMMQGSDQSLLRILHYPPVEAAEPGAIRAAEARHAEKLEAEKAAAEKAAAEKAAAEKAAAEKAAAEKAAAEKAAAEKAAAEKAAAEKAAAEKA